MKPISNLSRPYVIVDTDVFNALENLVVGLQDILWRHRNDNKQLDDLEYEWLLRRLDDLRVLTKEEEEEA
ncbi:MAG: hypothetical protein ACXADS_16630 [Candidatus Thorarchaeota archaeon]